MYKIYYRCKLCQELYSEFSVPDQVEAINMSALLTTFGSTKSLLNSRSIEKTGMHRCSDSSIGVSEFIGFRYVPDPPSPDSPISTPDNSSVLSNDSESVHPDEV